MRCHPAVYRAVSFLTVAGCGALSLLAGCGGGNAGVAAGTPAPQVVTASVSASSLAFPATTVSLASATQSVTLNNTGSLPLTLSGISLTGSAAYTQTNTCGGTVAAGASCVATLTFAPTASGPFAGLLAFTGNFVGTTLSVVLNGTAVGVATAAATADCSVSGGTCGAALPLPAIDPISPGGFHGYADPSFRKDPNSQYTYLAYSWPRTLPDSTHVVDIHLAQSANGGTSFTEVGPLYQSAVSTQTTSAAYNAVNYSSTETIDVLPVPLTGAAAGQTLWVQAHLSYLVKPQADIYAQLNPTNFISVTAVQLATPAAASAGTSLLALGAAGTGEARLGASDTEANRNPTLNLNAFTTNAARCGNWGQPALWYQAGTLYLSLECSEIAGSGQLDANELAHFVFVTTPTGADASKWTWSYAGEYGVQAQALKVGALANEGVAYQFFTENEFALTKAGQLVVIMTPSVFAPQTSQQPVIQYGCRAFPITLTPTSVALLNDPTTSTPVYIAKTTETDLYSGVNEGPAACTYEPNSNLGIIMGRKYENDPTYGFYIFPVNTGIAP